jgi:hypothetical protein
MLCFEWGGHFGFVGTALEIQQEKMEGNHEWTLIDTNATKGEQR